MIYRIEVTQEDIDLAREILSKANTGHCRRNCCPLARAIRRCTPWSRAGVGLWAISNGECGRDEVEVDLPPEAFDFRKRFDAPQPVEPISFNLEVPDEGNR